jgi:signal transduction histidine kinase
MASLRHVRFREPTKQSAGCEHPNLSEREFMILRWPRSFHFRVHELLAALTGVCVLGAAAVGWIAWQQLGALQEIGGQVGVTTRIQNVGIRLQRMMVAHLADITPVDAEVLTELRREVGTIQDLGSYLHDGTGSRLDRLDELLEKGTGLTREEVAGALALIEQVVVDESALQTAELEGAHTEARLELEMATAVMVALLAVGVLGFGLVSRRILRPLVGLREMFDRLSSGEFSQLSLEGVDPSLEPLLENYNRLVARLEELEQEHRVRATSLEGEVRLATQTLLEQQSTLASSERLAAVGEMAASLAHELRNPLAAVRMTLSNLRGEIKDEALERRVGLAMRELDRLTALLNQRLSDARHTPERSRPLDLKALVDDLLALLRYQVPEKIRLRADVPAALGCALPRDRLRQALLNLVLNAVHAIGRRPGEVGIRARREGGGLVIAVSDDGPGFPPDVVESGPRPFVTGREGGTGLGLAIVRRLALDLGGEVALENTEPCGARVRLVLPCNDA